MIPQKSISKISNKTFELGGRRIPEAVIERDYCLSWFLFGLAQSPLKASLIFKGGTALRRCYFEDYRFSEDLDYTLIDDIPLSQLLVEFEQIFLWAQRESGIVFSNARQEPSSTNTHTFYISYIGPLPGKEKEVKVDVTFKEIILTAIQERHIIRTYPEYDDFLDEPTIKIYSLNEVAIEKICALFSPARNEPRDLYDIYHLINNEKIDVGMLLHNVHEKMNFKKIIFENVINEFSKKEIRLKKSWEKRLSQQMASLPQFDKVFRIVKRTFRQEGYII
jgi:hypothetical protein